MTDNSSANLAYTCRLRRTFFILTFILTDLTVSHMLIFFIFVLLVQTPSNHLAVEFSVSNVSFFIQFVAVSIDIHVIAVVISIFSQSLCFHVGSDICSFMISLFQSFMRHSGNVAGYPSKQTPSLVLLLIVIGQCVSTWCTVNYSSKGTLFLLQICNIYIHITSHI